jgi:hypothetical protein
MRRAGKEFRAVTAPRGGAVKIPVTKMCDTHGCNRRAEIGNQCASCREDIDALDLWHAKRRERQRGRDAAHGEHSLAKKLEGLGLLAVVACGVALFLFEEQSFFIELAGKLSRALPGN